MWILWFVLLLLPAAAATQPTDAPVRVLVRVAPPFVIDDGDGEYSGISIDLWRRVAERERIAYTYEETGLEDMLARVSAAESDIGVGATTITAAREATLDFLHPFLTSGLSIAARATGDGWTSMLGRVLSLDFVRAVAALILLLSAVGLVMWLFERRHNVEQFEPQAARGLWSSFWFAAVTMTTVGYGDKAPRTAGGRLVALVWMFVSIMVISFFTASIATTLTVQSLAGGIDGPEDLPHVRVGALHGTTGEAYLSARGIHPVTFDTAREAVIALGRGEVDAVVHDDPILRWEIREQDTDGLEVLPGHVARQDYGFVLSPGDPRRERLNQALLNEVESPAFSRILALYLGR